VNGTYKKGKYTHCGKVYYEKMESGGSGTSVIRWHCGGIWMFGPELSYDLKGFACVKEDTPFPTDVTELWKVFNDKGFESDPNMKVLIHTGGPLDMLEKECFSGDSENETPALTRNISDSIFE